MPRSGERQNPTEPPWFIGVIYTRPLLQLFRSVILAVLIALSFVKPRAVLQEAAAARIVWCYTGGGHGPASCVSSTALGESPTLWHSLMEAGHDVGKTPEVQPELFLRQQREIQQQK